MKKPAAILFGIAVLLLGVVAIKVIAVFDKAAVFATRSCVESLAAALQRAHQTNALFLSDLPKGEQMRIKYPLLVDLAKVYSLDCARCKESRAGNLCDRWDSEIVIERALTADGTAMIRVISAGPDRTLGTRDDIQGSRSVPQ